MRDRQPVLIALMSLLLLSATAVEAQATDTATYSVRFEATWSASSHPQSFPRNAHFSDLIGGVHNADAVIWQEEGVASPGIELMAELGRTSPLDTEIAALIAGGDALEVIRGRGIGLSPGQVSTSFTVSRDFPLVTLVSMLAPSPDWFVGVSGLSLLSRGEWVEQRVVTLHTWDAGTDSGTSYTSSDRDTRPQQPIRRLTSGPFANNQTPVGSFIFTRQDSPEPEALLLGSDRFRLTAEWQDFNLIRGQAKPVTLTRDTGYFWFFNERNVELVVKVINGCSLNQSFWVFAGGLTSVEVELTVEDTETGQINVYSNALGDPFQPIQDTRAFSSCP